ncbi:hypothetical protein N0V93_003087 [Gnomoniopsis smithogilvyi]|uniref:Tyrosinase copper-binding domain-containing protein n=1 Tax=Gnomoniopsis smithogilvyi TaxID=1191159 RepID=A0A9W8YXY3_9PEZI|nr:hypothetical protein N0V93_003087 [Gnomoniopsis smithogilvyi]
MKHFDALIALGFVQSVLSSSSSIHFNVLDTESLPISVTPDVKCTSNAIRKEWSSLAASDRLSYINAVVCLQSLPTQIPAGLVPGAVSRFDDFVATHINNTLGIHLNGKFLSWHRQFLWLYEKTLQEECGFNGTQPYWNWSLYLDSPYHLETSLLFDGSPTSMSNNGVYDPNISATVVGGGAVLPRGNGGGCVTEGPFVNQTLQLGPFDFSLVYGGVLPANWTSPNPRCLTRDLSVPIAQMFNNASAVAFLSHQTQTIAEFQGNMSGIDNPGVHGGGHFSLGATGADFFASPNDPAFWLHHGMIDKLWTDWQALDPERRTWALNGTDRIFDPPGATEMTLDYEQDWGYLGAPRQTRELLRVGYQGFCYRYE